MLSNRFFRNRQILCRVVKICRQEPSTENASSGHSPERTEDHLEGVVTQTASERSHRAVRHAKPPNPSLGAIFRFVLHFVILCCDVFSPGQGLANSKQYNYKLTKDIFLMC